MDTPVVLWADEQLAVVNKPHGMIVHHPDGGADLLSALVPLLPYKRVHACHRLDAAAAGAMLVSSPVAAAAATALFSERRVFKLYVAVCRGTPSFREAVVDAPLQREGRRSRAADEDDDDGRPSRTDLTVLALGRESCVVAARTHGGRFHQVRAHLAHAGHPLLGDRQYGGGAAPCLGLHAARLAARHPLRPSFTVDAVAPFWPAFIRTLERAGITAAQRQDILGRVNAWPVELPA